MLPKISYVMKKNKQRTVTMRGINYSNMTVDGDIADSRGISARAYPYITTAKQRTPAVEYDDVTAMTVFQGAFVFVRGDKLFWRGEEIGTVLPGEKQFAAVNTKLVIMPDKKYLDGQTGELCDLGARIVGSKVTFSGDSLTLNSGLSVAAEGYGARFSGNTMTVDLEEELCSFENGELMLVSILDGWHTIRLFEKVAIGDVQIGKYLMYYRDTADGYLWTHAHCVGLPKSLTDEQIDKIQNASQIYVEHDRLRPYYFPSPEYKGEFKKISVRDVDIDGNKYLYPFNISSEIVEWSHYEDERETFEGATIYAIIDLSERSSSITPIQIGSRAYSHGGLGEITRLRGAYFDSDEAPAEGVYKSGRISIAGWKPLSEFFKVGDYISANGSVLSRIVEIEEGRLVVAPPEEEGEVWERDSIAHNFLVRIYQQDWSDGGDTSPDLSKTFRVGDVVTIEGSANNSRTFRIQGIDGLTIQASPDLFTAGEEEGVISIERRVPTLDFICESDNRLWGCSNADRTIYASALGDPTNIYTYQGISTDSWAVGVGSEEDFTGCIAHDGGVLFFKEMKLHKIVGSVPEEYRAYEYNIDGVQKGCHKSLQIMNEVLYYKGVRGVFAYTGAPSLISASFGEKEFSKAVAGADGDTYYISMIDRDGGRHLFAYETLQRLWVLEDDVRALDFTRIGKELYMLSESGEVWLCGAKDTPMNYEWFVQFTPFYETLEGRKTYSRLLLRVSIPQNSYMIVEVRCDGGAWREAGKIIGEQQGVVPVIVPISRCDKFEIRIRGKGKGTILSILREYYVGGEK